MEKSTIEIKAECVEEISVGIFEEDDTCLRAKVTMTHEQRCDLLEQLAESIEDGVLDEILNPILAKRGKVIYEP